MRFVVTDQATMYPGNCICGAGKPPFVDTIFQNSLPIGRDARVYLCSRCVDMAARALDYVPDSSFDDAREQLAALTADCERLIAELAEAKDPARMLVPLGLVQETVAAEMSTFMTAGAGKKTR